MTSKIKKILVTGHLGFIGFHVTKKFILLGYDVMGIDSLNKYYSVKLKRDRGKVLDQINGTYESVIGDLSEIITLKKLKNLNQI